MPLHYHDSLLPQVVEGQSSLSYPLPAPPAAGVPFLLSGELQSGLEKVASCACVQGSQDFPRMVSLSSSQFLATRLGLHCPPRSAVEH